LQNQHINNYVKASNTVTTYHAIKLMYVGVQSIVSSIGFSLKL